MKNKPIKVRGIARLLLEDVKTGKLQYREVENVVTQDGYREFIIKSISDDLSGQVISHGAIATQTAAINSATDELAGEFETRKDVTGSDIGVGTLRNTWSYATNEATQSTLGAIGLFNSSNGSTMFAAATFTTSDKTTNQTLAITYDHIFQAG